MTYFEAERYFEFYVKTEVENRKALLKQFAFYNLETSILAQRGTKLDLNRYLNGLAEDNEKEKEQDFEAQFERINFEQ